MQQLQAAAANGMVGGLPLQFFQPMMMNAAQPVINNQPLASTNSTQTKKAGKKGKPNQEAKTFEMVTND